MVTAPGAPRPVTPVGLVADRLARALELLDDAEQPVDPEVLEAVQQAHAIAAGLDPYLEECAGPESPALRALADETAATDWSRHPGAADGPLEQEMLSGHVEGRLLQLLVRAIRARKVLEIGMFTGYSALAMAEALPEDGCVVACELDPFAAGVATRAFGASPAGGRIDVRLGPAQQTMEALAAEQACFDLVFIDADKAGYVDHLHALLELDLVTEDSLICVDNTLMQGQPWTGASTPNGEAIQRFNRAVVSDPRVEQVLLPLRDGLTLIRRVPEQAS